MDYTQSLWDMTLPTLGQMQSTQDDSDFLAVLSKQLNPMANSIAPPPLPLSSSTIQGASPSSSEESSSPSPPTAIKKGLARHSGSGDSHKKDDSHKRKVEEALDDEDDDDDLEGQPQSKSQKEQPGKKGPAKRKSNGGDDRALKRKEQNRAAQRAFRERKEKHVKDLEDQVAELEEKSSAQATENENLRELLSRLQNENLMLKQSAFTFNFPGANTGAASSPVSASTTNRPTPSSSAKSPADSDASPKDTPPQSMDSTMNGNSGYTPLLSFNNLLETTTGNTSNDMSPPLTFFSPPPAANIPSPYTTIASNPMYTSYTDFSGWDQFFAETALDQTLAGVTMPQSSPLTSNDNGMRMNDNSLVNTSVSGLPSSGGGNQGMEDLFASTGNFGDLIPFSGFSPSPNSQSSNIFGSLESPMDRMLSNNNKDAFSLTSRDTTSSTNKPSLAPPPRTSSPCGGADADEAPLPGSRNYQSTFHDSGMSIIAGTKVKDHDSSQCPTTKEAMAKIIESEPLATLGTVPGTTSTATIPEEIKMARSAKLEKIWDQMKSDPKYGEVDISDLCDAVTTKCKCSDFESDENGDAADKILKVAQALRAEREMNGTSRPTLNTLPPQQPIPQHRPSLTSNTDSLSGMSTTLTTPASPFGSNFLSSSTTGNEWMNDVMMNPIGVVPSEGSGSDPFAFLLGGGSFSPNAFLNLPDKE